MRSSWVRVALNQMTSVLRRRGKKTERKKAVRSYRSRWRDFEVMELQTKDHQGSQATTRSWERGLG